MTQATSPKAYCVLYNPLSSTGTGEQKANILKTMLKNSRVEFKSLLDIPDKREFLQKLDPDITPIITGGDGTLSHFVNQLDGENPTRDIYYYPSGTGNDFLNDIGRSKDTEPSAESLHHQSAKDSFQWRNLYVYQRRRLRH